MVAIDGDINVNHLGLGAMRIAGIGLCGGSEDRAAAFCASSFAETNVVARKI